MHSLHWCNLSKFRNRAIFRTLLSKVFHEIVCVFFGLRTGADVLGVLYLASECIFHFGPRGIWYFELGVIWQVFARICHFGLGGIWQVFACIWYFGLGGVLFRRILSSEGKSSSDGGKSETCSHNATISAFFCRTSFGLDSRQEFQITQYHHSSKEFTACSNYAGSQPVRPMQAMLTQFWTEISEWISMLRFNFDNQNISRSNI